MSGTRSSFLVPRSFFQTRKPLLALVLLVALGCSRGHFSEQNAQSHGNTLRYCLTADPTTLDPALAQDLITGDMIAQVYEGLVTLGVDNKIHGQLAESWDIQDGGKTYVFHLKKGIKFTNGKPLTAADCKWTFERNCNPALNSILARDYLGDIVGAKDKIAGKAKEVSGVQAVDDSTLKITLDAPHPYFLGKLTYGVAYVLNKDAHPSGGEIKTVAAAIGTGPFIIKSFETNAAVQFVANKDYRDGAPKVDGIYLAIIKDSNTRLNKFKAGELDFLTVDSTDVKAVLDDPTLKSQVQSYDRPGLYYVGLNGAAYAPFQDRRVRRAFAMAIDRKRIVEQVMGGIVRLADGILPPAMPGHRDNPQVIPFDVAGAKALLKEANVDPANMPEIDLYTSVQSPSMRVIADSIVTMFRENLGVNAKVRTLEWAAFLQKTNKKQAGVFLADWFADYLDPENFLSLTLASYGQNRVAYDNPKFSELCHEADTIMDEPKREQLYGQAEDLVLQDAVWVPIYFPKDYTLVRPGVTGIRNNVFGFMPHLTTSLGK